MKNSAISLIKEKILALDNLYLSKFVSIDDRLHYKSEIQNCISPLHNKNIDLVIATYFERCNKSWVLRNMCYTFGECIIEPEMGWAYDKKFTVISQSNIDRFDHRLSKPSTLKYLLSRKKFLRFEKVIPIFFGAGNYWHFYNDMIGQIGLAEDLDIDDVTFIIPTHLSEKRFYRDFLSLSTKLRSKNIISVNKNEYVKASTAFFLKTWFSHSFNFNRVLDFIDWNKVKLGKRECRKIFLGRRYGRTIVNMQEVVQLVNRYGYEYVETEEMSLIEQISLFQSCTHIIGIHGAGLTNIIFCKNQQLKLLEIFSEAYINPAYFWIANQFCFEYGAISCKSISNNLGVSLFDLFVDTKCLEDRINQMEIQHFN